MSYSKRVQQRPIVEANIPGIVAGIKKIESRDPARPRETFEIVVKATGENPDYPKTLEPAKIILERDLNDKGTGYTIAGKRVVIPVRMVFAKINIVEAEQNSFDLSLSDHGKILHVNAEAEYFGETKRCSPIPVFSRYNKEMGNVDFGV
jgi:hypothetical protein